MVRFLSISIAIQNSLIFAAFAASTIFGQPAQRPNTPSFDTKLTVDKTTLSLPCRYPFPAKYRSCPDGMTVNVTASVKNTSLKNLKYKYEVSGGVIVGTGSKVVWDMAKARPGTYEITVTAYRGSRAIGPPPTMIVRVQECADCTAECLSCPDLTIRSSKEFVNHEDIVEFYFPNVDELNGQWKIEGGKIIKGQGTGRINVRIDKNAKDAVFVTVEVNKVGFCFEYGHCPTHSEFQLPVGNRELE